MPAQNDHVAPSIALLVSGSEQVGHLGGLVAEVGQANNQWRVAFLTAADGMHAWYPVFAGVFGAKELGGNLARGVQNLLRVAVVDPEDGRAALGLDPHALEAELLVAAALVDALRIVI